MKRLLKWYYGSASIRKKLVISYLLLITVPILVLGVYSYSVSKRNMERQKEETIRNNVGDHHQRMAPLLLCDEKRDHRAAV